MFHGVSVIKAQCYYFVDSPTRSYLDWCLLTCINIHDGVVLWYNIKVDSMCVCSI